MTTPEEGVKAQIKNIEATYGRTTAQWTQLVAKSGKTKHNEIVAMLKTDHGMTHGNANRVALVARDEMSGLTASTSDPLGALYDGKKAELRPIHERLMKAIATLGDFEIAPKRSYVSLRRRKQFAIVQPASDRIDVGLILPDVAATARLQPSGTFNSMCTHRVRVRSADEVDDALVGWLRQAYEAAG